MATKHITYQDIKGWGVDADPRNEPTYPMKHYTGDDHKHMNYERPPQQEETVEILKSIERPTLSAVFGTPNPPSGLSGMVRRLAFKFTESEYGHWLPLLLADRINVVEGIVDDIRHGRLPNLLEEYGLKDDWKLNKKGVLTKVAITTAVATGIIVYLNLNQKKKKRWF